MTLTNLGTIGVAALVISGTFASVAAADQSRQSRFEVLYKACVNGQSSRAPWNRMTKKECALKAESIVNKRRFMAVNQFTMQQ